jgi:hypothetical protein
VTPLAIRAFEAPLFPEVQGFIREIMVGAQYFDCSALAPIIDARASMPGDWHCSAEIVSCELPAQHTWIDIESHSIALSRDPRGQKTASGRSLNLVGALLAYGPAGAVGCQQFMLFEDGDLQVNLKKSVPDKRADEIAQACQSAINSAWYCIEAMQTAGLCHGVDIRPSRQQARSRGRRGIPIHKFVEIRLGKKRACACNGKPNPTGKTVAWHYRRGHRVEHPNPNYPKWRKGGWVGDPQSGIRTHRYTVDVPA